ncbi:MAG: response regulator [Legionella sp.]|nr:response regulator [Legionella sp.]
MNVLPTHITSLYHPIKVVVLDDNENFLNVMALEFHDHDNFLMVSNPGIALKHIESGLKHTFKNQAFEADILNPDDFLKKNPLIDFIYNPYRFNQVGVIIVDYIMPSINGVDFCKQLRDKPIYKILITAEADKDIAVNAFNEGIIDKFILKSHLDFYGQIRTYIRECSLKYFINCSHSFLTGCNDKLKSLFNNHSYKKLFEIVLIQSQAIEYYLVDSIGSFLFLTKNGEPTWLLISDQDRVNNQVDLLIDYCFPEDSINRLKNKEDLLFLFSENEHKEDLENWNKYIFHSSKLDEYHNYSVVSGKLTNSINWDRIATYESMALLV